MRRVRWLNGAAPGGKANYLLPVNTKKSTKADQLETKAFTVEKIVDRMEGKQTQLNIVLLDACRDVRGAWWDGDAPATLPDANGD